MPEQLPLKPKPSPEEMKNERLNKVYLRGYVGKDAEITLTATGKHRAYFTIATGGGPKKDGGEYPPEWHRIVCWGSRAAACDVLKEGSHVYVEGRLEYWSNGGRTMAQVAAHRIEIDGMDIMNPEAHYIKQAPVGSPAPGELEIADDDIPF